MQFNAAQEDVVSHSCVKPVDTCHDGGGFAGDLVEETVDLVVGHEQCQYVAAGGTANFLLKDGDNKEDGCGNGSVDFFTLDGTSLQPRNVFGPLLARPARMIRSRMLLLIPPRLRRHLRPSRPPPRRCPTPNQAEAETRTSLGKFCERWHFD